MDKQCECGAIMILKSGTSKSTGKPWKGYFCSDKNCTEGENGKPYVEWVKDTKPSVASNDSIVILGQIRDLLKRLVEIHEV